MRKKLVEAKTGVESPKAGSRSSKEDLTDTISTLVEKLAAVAGKERNTTETSRRLMPTMPAKLLAPKGARRTAGAKDPRPQAAAPAA